MLLDRIRRVTRDGRWIPEIDGLRFIAIFAVLLFHIAGEMRMRSGAVMVIEPRYLGLDRWLNNGDRGVELFFVISGMILAMPFARHYLLGARPVSLRKFYIRRVTRLEPPYLLSILLFSAMVAIYSHGHLEPHFGRHALASAFYMHQLIYQTMSPVNPVSWSLEVEIQFYLLAPLFMQLLRLPGRLLRRSVLLLAIVALGLEQYFLHDPLRAIGLSYFLQYFIAGLLLADIFVLDLDRIKSSWLWDAVALVALLFTFGLSSRFWWVHTVLPFSLIPICVAAMRSRLFRAFVSTPIVAVIGGMCYSIYLLHFAIIAAVFKFSRHLLLPQLDFPAKFALQVIVLGIPVMLLSLAFFLLVERPCMDPDWPGHLWNRLTGHSAQQVDLLDTAGTAPDAPVGRAGI